MSNPDDLKAKIQAQIDYCKKTQSTQFAPRNGICYRCNRQIYSNISLEKASSELITGCPHCHYSYCE